MPDILTYISFPVAALIECYTLSVEIKQNNQQNLIVRHINDEILSTYPFLNLEEKVTYEDRAKEILTSPTFTNPLEEVNKLLGLLNNPHADTWPIKEEKDKKPPQKPVVKIENGILYIRVPAWTKRIENLAEDLISFCRENEEKYKAVVIDVRDNTGGSSFIAHKFAGIFFKEDIPFGRFIKRIKDEGLQEKEAVMPANGDVYIDKPLAILISNKCFSSNELFLAPFKVTGRAILIGEKTAGGSGNPVEIDMDINGKKYIARIPTWRFVLRGETKPIEDTAIVPDVPYSKDDIMEVAKTCLEPDLYKAKIH